MNKWLCIPLPHRKANTNLEKPYDLNPLLLRLSNADTLPSTANQQKTSTVGRARPHHSRELGTPSPGISSKDLYRDLVENNPKEHGIHMSKPETNKDLKNCSLASDLISSLTNLTWQIFIFYHVLLGRIRSIPLKTGKIFCWIVFMSCTIHIMQHLLSSYLRVSLWFKNPPDELHLGSPRAKIISLIRLSWSVL